MRLIVRAVELRHPTEMDSSKWPPPRGVSTALCQNEYANADLTTSSTRSALTEPTPLECDIDLPRNMVEE